MSLLLLLARGRGEGAGSWGDRGGKSAPDTTAAMRWRAQLSLNSYTPPPNTVGPLPPLPCRTPESVVFESYYPASMGGGMFFTYTYTGLNNFVPGTERVHINYWVSCCLLQHRPFSWPRTNSCVEQGLRGHGLNPFILRPLINTNVVKLLLYDFTTIVSVVVCSWRTAPATDQVAL